MAGYTTKLQAAGVVPWNPSYGIWDLTPERTNQRTNHPTHARERRTRRLYCEPQNRRWRVVWSMNRCATFTRSFVGSLAIACLPAIISIWGWRVEWANTDASSLFFFFFLPHQLPLLLFHSDPPTTGASLLPCLVIATASNASAAAAFSLCPSHPVVVVVGYVLPLRPSSPLPVVPLLLLPPPPPASPFNITDRRHHPGGWLAGRQACEWVAAFGIGAVSPLWGIEHSSSGSSGELSRVEVEGGGRKGNGKSLGVFLRLM